MSLHRGWWCMTCCLGCFCTAVQRSKQYSSSNIVHAALVCSAQVLGTCTIDSCTLYLVYYLDNTPYDTIQNYSYWLHIQQFQHQGPLCPTKLLRGIYDILVPRTAAYILVHMLITRYSIRDTYTSIHFLQVLLLYCYKSSVRGKYVTYSFWRARYVRIHFATQHSQ